LSHTFIKSENVLPTNNNNNDDADDDDDDDDKSNNNNKIQNFIIVESAYATHRRTN